MAQDYYSILGVPRDASAQDIKKAFRAIARECHPDVAGADPRAEERFKTARKAYETLMDPVTRARYDRRGQRRAAPRGSFFDAFYRSTGGGPTPNHRRDGSTGAHAAGGHESSRNADKDPANDLDLDDLFNDFGDFGFGRRRDGARAEQQAGPRVETPPPDANPIQGSDVHLDLEVPAKTARDGGSVTVVYYRMQRADSWRPGAPDPGVVRVQDIADIRIIPGTGDGEVLRERGLGDAGPHGGPYGDLVARVRVVGKAPPPPKPPPRDAKHERGRTARDATRPGAANDGGDHVLDISVVEALLGGRVDFHTPQGPVRLTLPPGTSSGTRLRLKGKGPEGPGGPTDLYVVTRIVVPKDLDEQSRRLIEEFARLNPQEPRG